MAAPRTPTLERHHSVVRVTCVGIAKLETIIFVGHTWTDESILTARINTRCHRYTKIQVVALGPCATRSVPSGKTSVIAYPSV